MIKATRYIFATIVILYVIPTMLATSIDDSIRIYNNRGIDFFLLDDIQSAEVNLRISLNLAEKKYGASHTEVADAYNNLGVILMKAWQYDTALFFLNSANEIYMANNTPLAIANVYSNIGNIYRYIGDYGLAIHYYNKARMELTPLKSQLAVQRRLEVLNRIGLLQLEQKNHNQAALYFKQAVRIIENNSNDQFQNSLLQVIYVNLSSAYSFLGNNDSCLFYFNKAKAFLDNKSDSYYYDLVTLQVELTDHYLRQQDYPASLKSIHLTEKYLDNGNDLETNKIILQQYGRYHLSQNNFPQTIEYFSKALTTITSNTNGEGKVEYGAKNDAIELLQLRSEAYTGWHQQTKDVEYIQKALEDIRTATQLIDISRTNYLSMESKLFITEHAENIYDLGVYCSSALFEQTNNYTYLEEAFYYAEKGKSAILADALHEERAKEFADIPQKLIEYERSLIRDKSFYNEKLYEENIMPTTDTAAINRLKNKLFELNIEHESLKEKFEKLYPEYYAFKYTNNTISLEKLKMGLNRNQTLIEYVMTDSILYTFVVNKKHIELHHNKIPPYFTDTLKSFLRSFTNFSFHSQGQNIYSTYESDAYNLFRVLFEDISLSQLKTELIIIPDRTLSYLPFESLVSNKSSLPTSFRDLHFFLYSHFISYSYSATLHIQTSQNTNRKLNNNVLAIAPAYSHNLGDKIHTNSKMSYTLRDKLLPLPYAKEEVKAISKLTRGKALFDTNATLDVFLNNVNKYDILHLSMHTLINDKEPLYSKLVFYDKDYSNNQGLLNTSQLYALKLNAKLSILSACSSGDGEYKNGEGVMSLSRGFFYAGCPSLIMTLWKVEDKSGLMLMKLFYKNLLKGYSKPKALHHAKVEFLQTTTEYNKHPFFWASYILIGDTSPIYYSRSSNSIILIVAVVFLIVFLSIKKRKRKVLPPPKLN